MCAWFSVQDYGHREISSKHDMICINHHNYRPRFSLPFMHCFMVLVMVISMYSVNILCTFFHELFVTNGL